MLLRAGLPVTLYADLPYCVLHGWSHWVDGAEPDPHRNVDEFWLEFLKGVPEFPALRSARVKRLDDTAAAAKFEAMRCYETQFSGLDYGAGRLLSATSSSLESFPINTPVISSASGSNNAECSTSSITTGV